MINHILSSEFFEVFPYQGGYWLDIEEPITIEEVNSTIDCNIQYDNDYLIDYHDFSDKRSEHIQRIKNILKIPVESWKPISLDVDYQLETITIDDGHHRLFAAKMLGIKLLPIEKGGYFKPYRITFPKSYRRRLFCMI